MALAPNQYHILAFDPGGRTGWAHLQINAKAFSRPEAKVLRWLEFWDCGELSGPEHDQLTQASAMLWNIHGPLPFNCRVDVISEDFELRQLVGSTENLLSPVRINAVLHWMCRQQDLTFSTPKRVERVSVTKERLNLYGFTGSFRKDEFAAIQHAVAWMRKVKQQSKAKPWKLVDGVAHNAHWDCKCACGPSYACDMTHPKR